jgi:DNA-directed RNA polymerase subunit RPC12/RpoP
MYKGAGVGTCRIGSKKYRSEDAGCDFAVNETESEVDSVTSGYTCYSCGDDITESEFDEACSIGPFDETGKEVHYYCSDCWSLIDSERERVRRQFEIP